MYQRSSTYIMTTKNGWDVLFAGWSSCASPFYLLTFCPSGLYSEDGPPTDIADRLSASFPHLMSIELGRRSAERIAELDKFVKCVYSLKSVSMLHRDLLNALQKRGFRTNQGIHGTGFGLLAWSRAGGYYLGIYVLQFPYPPLTKNIL